MKQFRRGVSLTLLVLASVILVIELFRTGGAYPRAVLASTLALFCGTIQNLSAKLFLNTQRARSSENANL